LRSWPGAKAAEPRRPAFGRACARSARPPRPEGPAGLARVPPGRSFAPQAGARAGRHFESESYVSRAPAPRSRERRGSAALNGAAAPSTTPARASWAVACPTKTGGGKQLPAWTPLFCDPFVLPEASELAPGELDGVSHERLRRLYDAVHIPDDVPGAGSPPGAGGRRVLGDGDGERGMINAQWPPPRPSPLSTGERGRGACSRL
jgi:hypothetical protein